jgi:ABC-type multidrug transport system ATPase subunit
MDNEIAIAWIDLNFSIKSFLARKKKLILNDLNGSVNFGSLNALMGPSGAGKTTLLKCINGKNKFGLEEKSKIYLNSNKKIRSCLIGNNEKERLIIGLTAKQNLIYASKLKNSGENFKINHENNVHDLLSELMISDIADTKVEFCSGGEKRRLLIALELTSHIKPNLLCIDEPTSGLDSNAAEGVNIHILIFLIC